MVESFSIVPAGSDGIWGIVALVCCKHSLSIDLDMSCRRAAGYGPSQNNTLREGK